MKRFCERKGKKERRIGGLRPTNGGGKRLFDINPLGKVPKFVTRNEKKKTLAEVGPEC